MVLEHHSLPFTGVWYYVHCGDDLYIAEAFQHQSLTRSMYGLCACD